MFGKPKPKRRVWPSAGNAAKESFFALLQRNVLDRRKCTAGEHLGAGAVWRAIAWLSSDFMGENALEPTVQRFAANILAASGAANYSMTDFTK